MFDRWSLKRLISKKRSLGDDTPAMRGLTGHAAAPSDSVRCWWNNYNAVQFILQMASNHNTSRLSISELHSWHRNFYLHNRGSVVSSLKFINCIYFLFLPVLNHSALSSSPGDHALIHTRSVHTTPGSVAHTHTHTHTDTQTPFALRMRSAVSIFSVLMLMDQSVHTTARGCIPAVRSRSSAALVYVNESDSALFFMNHRIACKRFKWQR